MKGRVDGEAPVVPTQGTARQRPLIVGLTGGIATGKTTVARMLQEFGAGLVDADVLAREVVAPGEPALAEVREAFGPHVIGSDGKLDRKRLGTIVFGDPGARRKLEDIIHPRVRARIRADIDRLVREQADVVVVDVPLLFEGGGETLQMVDRTLVVYVDESTQLQRIMQRDGLDEQAARNRIEAQMPIDQKRRQADDVIDNRGDLAATRAQVRCFWEEWKRHCASP